MRSSILYKFLKKLWTKSCESNNIFKVFISSRPKSDIKHFFEDGLQACAIDVKNTTDIETYVAEKVRTNFREGFFARNMLSKQQDIIDKVLASAHGMYASTISFEMNFNTYINTSGFVGSIWLSKHSRRALRKLWTLHSQIFRRN